MMSPQLRSHFIGALAKFASFYSNLLGVSSNRHVFVVAARRSEAADRPPPSLLPLSALNLEARMLAYAPKAVAYSSH